MTTLPATESINTQRLLLEPFAEIHLNLGIVDWLNDRDVVRYSEQRHRTHTLESSKAYLDSFRGTLNHYWAMLLKADPARMVGSITAYIDPPNRVADIGILIGDKRCWGTGIGTEAFVAVMEWLFRVRGMRKVTAGTMSANEGMREVMRKAGMREEGRKLRHFLLDGVEVDLVIGAAFYEQFVVTQPGNHST
jgi:ribosomal-protein-alanine N-acetyltransferase